METLEKGLSSEFICLDIGDIGPILESRLWLVDFGLGYGMSLYSSVPDIIISGGPDKLWSFIIYSI